MALGLVILVVLSAPLSLGAFVVYQVYGGSYAHLERAKIIEILSKETTLYYSDGITQLGSLFGSEHRKYVTLKEIPTSLTNAIVAAEDDRFYTHPGVDAVSTLRAVFRNLFMGKREGASTITQQTVKNLYGREKTALKAKFYEAINSLKLERKYEKKEILEFYLNQFHVTGNGRGIGIASKYYFDKETENLGLVESAFIAGSVKAPEKYNPFTKRSSEAQKKARLLAKERKNYVLRRMLELKMIDPKEFEAAKVQEVPFRQGKFQFNDLFITELVERQMARPEILKALGVSQINEVGSMGLRVTTTLNKQVQAAAQYGVRQNLSRLEMILSGFKKEPSSRFMNIQNPEKFQFYVGKIKEITTTKGSQELTLSFGIPTCKVPLSGLERVANILDQTFYKGTEKSLAAFLPTLQVGDTVLASIKEIPPDANAICDLESRPQVQGGLVVLDKGNVLAMVGGYSPYEYNRAVFAKRQPGSTFKTLTYLSSLQLGWSVLDTLLNVRNVYVWQDQYYYPRPDHAPESVETTLAGAGSKSENLASVWLLAHLLDKLTFDQFKDLLEFLEIWKPGLSETQNLQYIGQKFNATLSDTQIRAGLFNLVRNDLLHDVFYSNDKRLRTVLKAMNFGLGFVNETARVVSNKKKFPEKEKTVRINLLRNNFLRWQNSYSQFKLLRSRLESAVQTGSLPEELKKDLYSLRVSTAEPDKVSYVSTDLFRPALLSSHLNDPDLPITPPETLFQMFSENPNAFSDEKIWLDGVLPVTLIQEMETQVEGRFQSAQGASALEKLFWNADFRYSVGMYYTKELVKEMGVGESLEWIPSFPLGTNVVSLAQLALTYQTLLAGKSYQYFDGEPLNQMLLISKIEDVHGNLIWESERKQKEVFDSFYTAPMMSILRGTVTNGTGYAAHRNVLLRSLDPALNANLEKAKIRIPTFGKTGTTNDYTNATYVGFLPYPDVEDTKELTAENAFTIAAYVGYDNNTPMLRRGFKVAGGTGALPAWIEVANSLIREYRYAEKIPTASSMAEVPFSYGKGLAKFAAPIHSPILSFADDTLQEDDNVDLNKQINDYSQKKGAPLHLALPGTLQSGVYEPQLRVSFFSRQRTPEASTTPSPGDTPPEDPTSAIKPPPPVEVPTTGPAGQSPEGLEDEAVMEEDL